MFGQWAKRSYIKPSSSVAALMIGPSNPTIHLHAVDLYRFPALSNGVGVPHWWTMG